MAPNAADEEDRPSPPLLVVSEPRSSSPSADCTPPPGHILPGEPSTSHHHHRHKSASPGKFSDGSEGISVESTASTSAASRTREEEEAIGRDHCLVTSLAWDVTYSIAETKGQPGGRWLPCPSRSGKKRKKKVILHSIVGQAEAGDLLAVMGPSGCGKSTFLSCLALRDQTFRGQIYLNEAPARKQYLSMVGFVDQHDLFYPTQTVREHLEFHAMVRLGAQVRTSAKMARIQEVLIELNLSHVSHTYIGGGRSAVRGLSGGERRRLSFATEMLSNPSIVIADEATTGLDASMAKSVCRVLRGMADSGRLVVASIHQPSSQTFSTFTHLMLLAGHGHIAYYGPTANLLAYLASVGLQCPPYHNMADFAVRCVAVPPGEGAEEAAARVVKLCTAYTESELAQQNQAWKFKANLHPVPPEATPTHAGGVNRSHKYQHLGPGWVGEEDSVEEGRMDPIMAMTAGHPSLQSLTVLERDAAESLEGPHPPPKRGDGRGGRGHEKVFAREYNASWTTQFGYSLVRQLQALQRDKKMSLARCFVGVGTGLVIGLAFRGPKGREFAQGGITDTLGLMLTSAIFLLITNFFQVAFTLPGELQVFFRERLAGVNRVSTYYVAHVVQSFAFLLVWTLAFCLVTFPLALNGLTLRQLAVFFLTVTLSNIASTALGYVVAISTRNEAVALALVPPISLPMALFAGFLVELNTVPPFLAWLQHLSIVKYTLHALVLEAFAGQDIHCPPSLSHPGEGSDGGGLPGGARCVYPSTPSVLRRCSADQHTLEENLIMLAGLGIGLLLLGYLVLARQAMTVKVR
ncbi:abc subfamily abcg [Nannochloropsis gaditana]|uniref:Abc subfamily abcg n=2 Tax=Nannochloropsis gaditana TaxID=72520 RepID=W7TN16_9STRA|nr:abc subfamily abcg [Nannochloropsis gaditana]